MDWSQIGEFKRVGFFTVICWRSPRTQHRISDSLPSRYHPSRSQRVPSYTDRILWQSNEETRQVEPILYEAVTTFASSDHKPVRGLFFLPSRSNLPLDASKAVRQAVIYGTSHHPRCTAHIVS